MLINKQKDIPDILLDLPNVHAKGDNLIFEHIYDVSDDAVRAGEIKMFSDNGWTKDREFRQIGHIPAATVAWLERNRPDVMRDAKLLKKWLMTEEGSMWRTVTAIDTGRKGNIIVK